MVPKTDFGGRLVAIRKERGMTQVQLAEAIGAKQPAISYYESNSGHPAAPVLAQLADALDVTTDELLGLQARKRSLRSTKPSVPPDLQRLWKQFQVVKDLSQRDQRTVIRLIRALAYQSKDKRRHTSQTGHR
jgi:transcriptional regulator with XRE-family HTH domain